MHHKGYTRKGVARLSTAVANLHTVESTAHVQQFLNRIHDTKVDIITQHLAADIDSKLCLPLLYKTFLTVTTTSDECVSVLKECVCWWCV